MGMSLPLVDILIPTHNPNPVFLRGALDCLLDQTEERWTCFIHDDASTGNVEEVIRPYLEDPRFTFVRSATRLGIGGNWNACYRARERLSVPRAPFVQYLFQDDSWKPLYLTSVISVLETYHDVGFVAVEHAYVCDSRLETAQGYKRLKDLRSQLIAPGRHNGRMFFHWWLKRGFQPNFIGEPSFVMMRRSLIENVGLFYEDLTQILDIEYWIRLVRRSDWFYLAENLGSFRVHRKAASYQHFMKDDHIIEHLKLLDQLRQVLPASTHLDQHVAGIVSHIVNRVIRGKGIGKGARPTLRYLRLHPYAALRGVRCYVVQAAKRWWRKGWDACTMMPCGKSPDPQYSVDRVAAFPRHDTQTRYPFGAEREDATVGRRGICDHRFSVGACNDSCRRD